MHRETKANRRDRRVSSTRRRRWSSGGSGTSLGPARGFPKIDAYGFFNRAQSSPARLATVQVADLSPYQLGRQHSIQIVRQKAHEFAAGQHSNLPMCVVPPSGWSTRMARAIASYCGRNLFSIKRLQYLRPARGREDLHAPCEKCTGGSMREVHIREAPMGSEWIASSPQVCARNV